MAKIVTITNPLTGQPAQVDQLDHTAQQIDDGLNIARNVSNQNLLDNWYLPNPVNQRGITTNWTSGYGPDRWLTYTPINAEISSAGLTLHMTGGTTGVIAQILEEFLFNELVGKVCTFSVLFADGTMRSGSAQVSPSETTLFISDYPAFGQCYLQKSRALQIYFTQERTIKAAKLELGSQQTLAHQEDGNWVLNEMPNYADMLERCQYYSDLPTTWAPMTFYVADFIVFTVKTHRKMRVNLNSANVTLDSSKLEMHSNGAAQSGFTFSVYGGGDDFILVKAAKSGHGLSNAMLIVNNGGIYANANM